MDGRSEKYVTSASIRKQFGVCNNTLRKYAEDGRIRAVRAGGEGKRLYCASDIAALFLGLSPDSTPAPVKVSICYARVSSQKQRPDLERQVEALKLARPGYEVITDIASGINWKRPGLLAILDRAMRGDVGEVVVAHRDRLCRFAFELLEHVFSNAGCKIVVLDQNGNGARNEDNVESELRDDLLAIVTVFVAANNGRRSVAHRRQRRESAESAKNALQKTGGDPAATGCPNGAKASGFPEDA